MSNGPTIDETARHPIELEPLARDVVTPDDQRPGAEWRYVVAGDRGNTIPNRPGFNCPDCDYDLRGLPDRNCPECGRHFTMSDARLAGLEYDPRAVDDRRAMKAQKRLMPVCIGLVVAAFFSPFVITTSWPSGPAVFFQLVIGVPFAICGIGYCHITSRPRSQGILIATSMYVAYTFVVDWLLW